MLTKAGAKENYWFGTDQLGRDLWTRTWKGAQISLYIGVVAALLDICIGVVYGAVSGFFGGRVDDVMQKDFRNYCFYTQFNCRYFIRTYF